MGCGEGALLEILLNDIYFTKLAGVDNNIDSLRLALFACQPTELDYRYLREVAVDIALYHGKAF